jgi:hypothetical protein
VSTTTDRKDPTLHNTKENGQNEKYLVLSEEERAKGFVRPVRRSYIHLKCGVETTMGLALCETYARDPSFYGATFCCGCSTHVPLLKEDGTRAFHWTGTSLGVGE